MTASVEKPALTRTLERGLSLLTLVAQGSGMSLTEISGKASMSASTALRLLETLRAHRFVERDAGTGLYRVAIGAFEVGSSYFRQNSLSESGRIVLRRLSGEVGQTANLSVLDRSDVVCIERVEAEGSRATRARWSERLPAHGSAAGKVILAWSWELRCDEILGPPPYPRLTPRTITDRETLMRELRAIRERGWAADEEEAVLGVRCIAAPVLEREGGVCAAISVTMLARPHVGDQEAVIVETVQGAARWLSVMLGWQPSGGSPAASAEPAPASMPGASADSHGSVFTD